MITPTDVLRQQVDLADQLADGTMLAEWLGNMIHDQGHVDTAAAGLRLARLVGQRLRGARTYRVAAAMTPAITLRAGTLHPDTVVARSAPPPRPSGFVVFEQPLRLREIRGRDQLTHALAWVEITGLDARAPTWYVLPMGDLSRDVDAVMAPTVAEHGGLDTWTRARGTWAPCTPMAFGPRHTVGPTRTLLTDDYRGRQAAEPGPPLQMSADNPVRHVAALWALLSETRPPAGVAQDPEHLDRATARRARREGVDPEVTTVLLRPVVGRPGAGTGKPLDHRVWVEGGFTRTYWTGPGRTVPVKRRIGGYWMGDETLPVRNRTVVNDLRA